MDTVENTVEQGQEKRSEQLNQKITPTTRKQLDDLLIQMGYTPESDGHVRWDQDKLLDMINNVRSHLVLDDHPSYAGVVTTINQYTSLINSKLISLISDLDITEARIRSEYEEQLTSKDCIIKDLQSQRAIQESEKKSAMEDASKSNDARTIAEKNLFDAEEKLKKAEGTVKDKDSIIQMLTSRLTEADEKLSGYDALRSSEASLKEQLSTVLHQKELIEVEVKHIEEQCAGLELKCEDLEKQLEEVNAKKSELHDQVNSLKRDVEEQKKTAEQSQVLAIERAVQKAREEMRKEAETEEKALREQIAVLRDEKTRLTVQLEMLQKKENATN